MQKGAVSYCTKQSPNLSKRQPTPNSRWRFAIFGSNYSFYLIGHILSSSVWMQNLSFQFEMPVDEKNPFCSFDAQYCKLLFVQLT